MSGLNKDTIQEFINSMEEMENSSKQLAVAFSNFENTITMLLKQELARLYTTLYLYKARILTSSFIVRWYWKQKTKKQGRVLRKFIENLPEGIKHEVTTELLEVTNGSR